MRSVPSQTNPMYRSPQITGGATVAVSEPTKSIRRHSHSPATPSGKCPNHAPQTTTRHSAIKNDQKMRRGRDCAMISDCGIVEVKARNEDWPSNPIRRYSRKAAKAQRKRNQVEYTSSPFER